MDRPGYRKLLTLGYDIIIQALPFHIYSTQGTMTKIVDIGTRSELLLFGKIFCLQTLCANLRKGDIQATGHST